MVPHESVMLVLFHNGFRIKLYAARVGNGAMTGGGKVTTVGG
ncbi:hypothetical protein A2U01_0073722, partial [Trifolium medium]|nr:hypothetical protein [Trifolium medium]